MSWLIMVLISIFSPVIQTQVEKAVNRVQTRVAESRTPAPPEVGQPGVVFHNGEWWKMENGQWLVWRARPQQLAQGGAHVLR